MSPPKVSYQGVYGSFGEQAGREYFGGTAAVVTNHNEFDNVFAALERRETDHGILPFEHSTTGEVPDLITRCSKKLVCGRGTDRLYPP